MADFQTHITTSTVLGIVGGLAANAFYDVPAPSCFLAAGLCSLAGMLPDLDSDSGVPLRESIGFAAAVIPMLMLNRLLKYDLQWETIILCTVGIYLGIRFGFASFLKNYTVHRGMFHSIPAALIFAEATFLIIDHTDTSLRLLNAGAVLVGFLSHLLLDEMWSVEMRYGLVHFKKSFGSAFKLWGDDSWGNLSTYAKLILLTFIVTKDQAWIDSIQPWLNGKQSVLANIRNSADQQFSTFTNRYLKTQQFQSTVPTYEEYRMASGRVPQQLMPNVPSGSMSSYSDQRYFDPRVIEMYNQQLDAARLSQQLYQYQQLQSQPTQMAPLMNRPANSPSASPYNSIPQYNSNTLPNSSYPSLSIPRIDYPTSSFNTPQQPTTVPNYNYPSSSSKRTNLLSIPQLQTTDAMGFNQVSRENRSYDPYSNLTSDTEMGNTEQLNWQQNDPYRSNSQTQSQRNSPYESHQSTYPR